MSGPSTFDVVLTVFWFLVIMAGTVGLVWMWRSPERSAAVRERFEPVRPFGLHARSMAAGILGGHFLNLPLWGMLFLDLGGRDRWGEAWYQFALAAGVIGTAGGFACALMIFTTAIWWRPRWIIPPHLRDRAAEEATWGKVGGRPSKRGISRASRGVKQGGPRAGDASAR